MKLCSGDARTTTGQPKLCSANRAGLGMVLGKARSTAVELGGRSMQQSIVVSAAGAAAGQQSRNSSRLVSCEPV